MRAALESRTPNTSSSQNEVRLMAPSGTEYTFERLSNMSGPERADTGIDITVLKDFLAAKNTADRRVVSQKQLVALGKAPAAPRSSVPRSDTSSSKARETPRPKPSTQQSALLSPSAKQGIVTRISLALECNESDVRKGFVIVGFVSALATAVVGGLVGYSHYSKASASSKKVMVSKKASSIPSETPTVIASSSSSDGRRTLADPIDLASEIRSDINKQFDIWEDPKLTRIRTPLVSSASSVAVDLPEASIASASSASAPVSVAKTLTDTEEPKVERVSPKWAAIVRIAPNEVGIKISDPGWKEDMKNEILRRNALSGRRSPVIEPRK